MFFDSLRQRRRSSVKKLKLKKQKTSSSSIDDKDDLSIISSPRSQRIIDMHLITSKDAEKFEEKWDHFNFHFKDENTAKGDNSPSSDSLNSSFSSNGDPFCNCQASLKYTNPNLPGKTV